MSIDTRISDDGRDATIKIAGRFDFSQHNDFRTAFEKAPGDVKSFTVDLSGTDYMDSSALGMLLVLRDRVEDKVKIVNARPTVKKILEIANFDKLFLLSLLQNTRLSSERK